MNSRENVRQQVGQDLHRKALKDAVRVVGNPVMLVHDDITQQVYIACGGAEGALSVLGGVIGAYIERKEGREPTPETVLTGDTILFAAMLAVAQSVPWPRGADAVLAEAYRLFHKATDRHFPEHLLPPEARR